MSKNLIYVTQQLKSKNEQNRQLLERIIRVDIITENDLITVVTTVLNKNNGMGCKVCRGQGYVIIVCMYAHNCR